MKKILIITFFLVLPLQAQAARLYLLPSSANAVAGEKISFDLRVDTQGDDMNALDVRVKYDEGPLIFDSFSDAGSMVNIWIERPQTFQPGSCGSRQKSPCKGVLMSGVAPGGFVGDGLVAQLVFKVEKSGTVELSIADESMVLANGPDGKKLFAVSNGSRIVVGDLASHSKKSEPIPDEISPDPFSVYLAHNPNAFEDKWFISFSAQDGSSGISHYEIEERMLGIFGGGWEKVENSPYVLKNQSLLSAIRVRAIDMNGKASETYLYPANLKIVYGTVVGIGVILLLLVGLRLVLKRLL